MDEQPVQQPGAAAPQYSPDRRWWWNGREWQPVPHQAPQPFSSSERIRPGRWFYLMAVLAVAVAAALAALVVQAFRTGFPTNATRVTAPGTTTMTLSEPGTYMISYERQTVGNIGGSVEVSSQPPSIPVEISSMELALVSNDSGAHVPIHAISETVTYSVGNTEGLGIARFIIDRPGMYTLASRYSNGQSGPQVVLAVARGSPGDVFKYVLGGLGVFALLVAGVGIAAVTVFLRVRSKDRARLSGNLRPGP